jgi:phospholipid/cholesterol/gamma-HCH transport system permease protein
MSWIAALGHRTLLGVEECGRVMLVLWEAMRWTPRRPLRFRLFVAQCLHVGVYSIPVVMVTGAFTGAVLALQTASAFRLFGAENLVATVVAVSMTRELGPVLTGIMVAGRVGSAMAAELGTMRVTEQIDALHTLATNPVHYLIVPRVWAATVMLPCLVIFSDLLGIVAGRFIAVDVLGNSPHTYFKRTVQYLDVEDISIGLLKAALFGLTLALIGCYQGYMVRGGAREVGFAVNRAVVLSIGTIFVVNYLVTAYFF